MTSASNNSSAVLAAVVLAVSLVAGCRSSTPPPSDGRTPVWIDTDLAIGEPERAVDDGFALVQALQSDTLVVRGVSAVFGNAPLVRTWPVTQDVVGRFGQDGLRPWRGAAGPHERHAPTEASEALSTALRDERLVVIALGPLTNIASALSRDPSLQARIERLVIVGGRHAARVDSENEGVASPAGPRDLNVTLDVEAVRLVLETDVPVTLVPFEQASSLLLTSADVERLADGPVAARFLAESSKGWLRVRQQTLGVDGFYPADSLAVDIVAHPGAMDCVDASAAVEGEALVVRDGTAGRPVTYCHTPDAEFVERLVRTLRGEGGAQ